MSSPPPSGSNEGAGGGRQFSVTGQASIPDLPPSAVAFHKPDVVRAKLASGVYWLLVGVLAFMGILLLHREFYASGKWDDLKDLFTFLVTPVLTLASFAFGFYFANASRE